MTNFSEPSFTTHEWKWMATIYCSHYTFLEYELFLRQNQNWKNSSLVPCSELHQRYSLRTFQLNSRLAFFVPKFCLGCNKLKLYPPGLNNHIWLNLLCSIWIFKFLVCMIQKLNYINYNLSTYQVQTCIKFFFGTRICEHPLWTSFY